MSLTLICSSYIYETFEAVLKSAKRQEKTKYNEARETRHAGFTPLCITISCLLVGDEMKHFLDYPADRLSGTIALDKDQLSFVLL